MNAHIANITPAPDSDFEQRERVVRKIEKTLATLDAVIAEAASLCPDVDPDTFLFGETK